MTEPAADPAPDGAAATAPETPPEPPRSAEPPAAGIPGPPEGSTGHTEPPTVLAFEVPLRLGATQDDAVAVTTAVLRALDGLIDEWITVTHVNRNRTQAQRIEEDLRQASLRADVLRQQVRDLEAERDQLAARVHVLTGELHRERDLHGRDVTDLTAAHAEIERLRGLLRELLHLADNGFMAPEVRTSEIARIRREAGLT